MKTDFFFFLASQEGGELARGASSGKREQLLWQKRAIRKLPRQQTSSQDSPAQPLTALSAQEYPPMLSRASFLGVSLLSTDDTAKSPVLQQRLLSQL